MNNSLIKFSDEESKIKSIKIFLLDQIKDNKFEESVILNLFDTLMKEAYNGALCEVACPYCEKRSKHKISLIARINHIKCEFCEVESVMVTGKVRAKRFVSPDNYIARDPGAHIRFLGRNDSERYVHLYNFKSNPELKSKDIFSLCIGKKIVESENNSYTNTYVKASILNISLSRSYFSVITYHEESVTGLDV